MCYMLNSFMICRYNFTANKCYVIILNFKSILESLGLCALPSATSSTSLDSPCSVGWHSSPSTSTGLFVTWNCQTPTPGVQSDSSLTFSSELEFRWRWRQHFWSSITSRSSKFCQVSEKKAVFSPFKVFFIFIFLCNESRLMESLIILWLG